MSPTHSSCVCSAVCDSTPLHVYVLQGTSTSLEYLSSYFAASDYNTKSNLHLNKEHIDKTKDSCTNSRVITQSAQILNRRGQGIGQLLFRPVSGHFSQMF